ncbi:MAG TPA: hypothetical protein DEF88_06365 [Porphyromonadaceae bacterium]|jgi:hypothetical protein|nr:hypothetical protein [Porphyromonadaceae bacterium]HCM19768.1 hypothetical protein [Porphyromonadaceae bacterium]
MSKYIIEFKEEEYKRAIRELDEYVTVINNTIIPAFKERSINVNIDVIREFFDDTKGFIDKQYKNKLELLCNNIEVKIQDLDYSKDESIHRLANISVKCFWDLKRGIKDELFSYYRCLYLLDDNYITVENEVAKKAANYDVDLKEKCTVYAENDKQKEAAEIVKTIILNINKLQEIGFLNNSFPQLRGIDFNRNQCKIESSDFQRFN